MKIIKVLKEDKIKNFKIPKKNYENHKNKKVS